MPISDRQIYATWSVVVVPFPYTDRLAEKRRPALVISNRVVEQFGLIWVAMITSAVHTRWACDIQIEDLAQTGLTSPSVVRPVKIACMDLSRIVRAAGQLSARDKRAVSGKLSTLFP